MAAKKLVYFDRFIAPVGEEELYTHPDVIEMVKLSAQDPRERLWEAMADAHGLHVQGRSMPPKHPGGHRQESEPAGYRIGTRGL